MLSYVCWCVLHEQWLRAYIGETRSRTENEANITAAIDDDDESVNARKLADVAKRYDLAALS